MNNGFVIPTEHFTCQPSESNYRVRLRTACALQLQAVIRRKGRGNFVTLLSWRFAMYIGGGILGTVLVILLIVYLARRV